MSHPRFSILIPSYNRPEFVGTAVGSVLASGVDDLEVIVSDDCSPRQAEIRAVLAPYLADRRVRFHAQPVNLREPRNRAFLQEAATGDWRLILGDDDVLHPSALRVLARQIEANPDVRLFAFGYEVIDEHSRVRYSRRAPKAVRLHRGSDAALLRDFLAAEAFPYWFCQPATFCCHRDVHERIAPNDRIGIADDLQFLIDYVNDGGTILVVPRVLMSYRRMASSHAQANQSLIPLANPYTRYRILTELDARTDLHPSIAAIVRTEDFLRRRFVYRPVALACATTPVEDAVAHLEMSDSHRAELMRYLDGRSVRSVKLAGYLSRSRFYLGLFGVRGALEILRVARQRAVASLAVGVPR